MNGNRKSDTPTEYASSPRHYGGVWISGASALAKRYDGFRWREEQSKP